MMNNEFFDYRLIYALLLAEALLTLLGDKWKNRIITVLKYLVFTMVVYMVNFMDFLLIDALNIQGNVVSKILQWIIYILLIVAMIREIIKNQKD